MAKLDGHGHRRGTSDTGLGPKAMQGVACPAGSGSKRICLGTADPGRQSLIQDQELGGLPRLPTALPEVAWEVNIISRTSEDSTWSHLR